MRFGVSMFRGVGLRGGHLETKGLSDSGALIQVPEHRHRVSLDFSRLELHAEYAFTDDWTVTGYLPYEVKEQRVSVAELEGTTAEERQAQLRNAALHHRDETYRGLADIRLLLNARFGGVLLPGDALNIRLGSSLPSGATESNPYLAGNAGEQHLHIQFGSGSFDPLAEVSYFSPLAFGLSVNTALSGKVGFYRNTKGYRRAPEFTQRLNIGYRAFDWLNLRTGLAGILQGRADWKSTGTDINSGIFALSYLFAADVSWKQWSLGVSAGDLLHQTIFEEGGDAWKQSLSFTVNLSWQRIPD